MFHERAYGMVMTMKMMIRSYEDDEDEQCGIVQCH